MSIPAFIPMLDLNNHLELGPDCPPEEEAPTCADCEQRQDCEYKGDAMFP